ncbi:MAG: hypothetical protein MSG64_20485 [Pyrinomonadaceae bacterium MAG19_C2-C3]|nr:hypothetical protein [Pyrinomonadaceae bacterium MAG19_C2-C3]
MSKKSREAIRNNLANAIAPPVPAKKRGAHLDGLLDEYSPPEERASARELSPTPNVSPTPEPDYALRGVSHAPNVSLTPNVTHDAKPADIWASVPETKGYSKQYHAITDSLFRLLDPIEQAVYTQLFRLTHGFNKLTCIISLPRLAERANIGTTATHGAVKRLVSKGLVEKRTWIVGKGKEQGIEFSLPLPAWLTRDVRLTPNASPTFNEPIKENTIKDTHNTEAGVRVSSRFTLQECRKYAESLRADGITNPGGYATKIHRSGEADNLVKAFLTPVKTVQAKDAGQCPDCHDTGFYEPGGAGKGVARCRHGRLSA